MGGFFGPELKYAGYDRIIIRGKSPELVYLWINNDKVEIRDASHLHGLGVNETAKAIKEELGEPRAHVACIGLAGENEVYTASIECGWSSAARGVGPVMGSKRLKAIAVRGTKDIYVAHPQELYEECRKMYEKINDSDGCGDWMSVDEDDSFHHNNFAWGNARTRIKNFWSDGLQERWTRWKYDNMDRQIVALVARKAALTLFPGRIIHDLPINAMVKIPIIWLPLKNWTTLIACLVKP
ncbi:MAG: putative oxidoreductase YdhV [Pelotomaculum sp. PtaB.Bin104]|nr:MAG: putative oxidoreductase YdhV [Pelotomaculum sp. PtaB.Bin104]